MLKSRSDKQGRRWEIREQEVSFLHRVGGEVFEACWCPRGKHSEQRKQEGLGWKWFKMF